MDDRVDSMSGTHGSGIDAGSVRRHLHRQGPDHGVTTDRAWMDHREELLQAFHIEMSDLAANRAGTLGPRQSRLLVRSAFWNAVGAAAICLALGVVLFAVSEKPLQPVQWILTGVLVVAGATLGAVQFHRLRGASHEGTVVCFTGPVRVRLHGRAGWFLHIDERSFRLPVKFWKPVPGVSYRVYIAPRVNRIVAMEPVGVD